MASEARHAPLAWNTILARLGIGLAIATIAGLCVLLNLNLHTEVREARKDRDRLLHEKSSLEGQVRNLVRQLDSAKAEIAKERKQSGLGKSDQNSLAGIDQSFFDFKKDIEFLVKRQQQSELDYVKVDKRLFSLESVIIESPGKAVSVPLLGDKIKRIEDQHLNDIQALRRENDKIYDLMKVLIGLLSSVSFAFIGLAAANQFKRDNKPAGVGERAEEGKKS